MQGHRQVWIDPEDIGGHEPRIGQMYALTRPNKSFALRGWDGTPELPAGQVVAIVETRPYGSALAQEFQGGGGVVQAAAELATDGLFELRITEATR